MFKTVHILLAGVVFFTLAGCGTKGPLYIPEQRYPQKPIPQDEGKMTAPEANSRAPSSPAQ